MMRYIIYLSMLCSCIGLISCDEKVVIKYEDENCLYFENFLWGQKDSIGQTFFGRSPLITRDTVWVDVRTMGSTSDVDRPIRIVQLDTEEENAAVAGVHYVAFDDAEVVDYMKVKAGQAKVMVPVIVLRDPSLKNKLVRIKMGIQENEHFKPGIDKFQTFVVRTTDQGEKPLNWQSWSYYFGEWSSLKMEFIIQRVGWNDFDNVPSDYGMLMFLQAKSREELKKYNDAERESGRPPLCPDHQGSIEETCENCVEFP